MHPFPIKLRYALGKLAGVVFSHRCQRFRIILVREAEAFFHEAAEPAAVHRLQDRPPQPERRRVSPALEKIDPPKVVRISPMSIERSGEPDVFHQLNHLSEEMQDGS